MMFKSRTAGRWTAIQRTSFSLAAFVDRLARAVEFKLLGGLFLFAICWAIPASADDEAAASAEPQYPLAVVADGENLFVVDLDLPGVWQVTPQGRELYLRGSNLLRKPMNRPRCVATHPNGGVLVGDSATREVYWIAKAGEEPKPLCESRVGIAMALAVSPDEKTVYVGDAEKRSVLRFPIDGGLPELVVRVNARGLAFDAEGKLWAVTPDAEAIHRIDVQENTSEPIVTGRPFQYPNGLVWAGDHGFVTDGYGKAIWKFTPDGKTELWHQGEPLVGPVGISLGEQSLLVADPKQLQVYEFNLESKQVTPRL